MKVERILFIGFVPRLVPVNFRTEARDDIW